MYELTIKGHSKSNAKLLCKRTKHFIVGQKYEIHFVVKNISKETSPSGRCFIIIYWPGSKADTTMDFHVKRLGPDKCDVSKKWRFDALSTGLALISLNQIKPNHYAYKKLLARNEIDKNGKSKLNFVTHDDEEKELHTSKVFDFFYVTTPEAIYEYYALIVAAISLVSLLLIEIYNIFFKR